MYILNYYFVFFKFIKPQRIKYLIYFYVGTSKFKMTIIVKIVNFCRIDQLDEIIDLAWKFCFLLRFVTKISVYI